MREIQLSQGRVALVDDSDFEHLSQWNWHAYFDGHNWYARRQVTIARGSRATHRQRPIAMHRQLLDPPPGVEVDHRDGDGLNNQRSNLRLCSHQENQRNKRPHAGSSSRFKGVSLYKRQGRWVAGMTVNGRRRHLGYFDSEEEAARAYDRAAVAMYGEFARTNFPGGSDAS